MPTRTRPRGGDQPAAPTHADLANTLAETFTSMQYGDLPVPRGPLPPRYCLISVGATAPFTPLVSAAFEPAFIEALIEAGYTRLVIQAGEDSARFEKFALKFAHPSLRIDCFGFVDELKSVMVMCRREEGVRETGVVICHAGTGTILDAMSLNVPLIVIPNPLLQDNHQVELAKELHKQRYALHGSVTTLTQTLQAHEARKSALPTSTPAVSVSVAPASERDNAPSIWDIACAITAQDRLVGNPSGARALLAMGEVERENFERFIEG